MAAKGGSGSGKSARGGGGYKPTKPFPLKFEEIPGIPSCPTLAWIAPQSTSAIARLTPDKMHHLQRELEDMLKVSRHRSHHVAQQLVMLTDWHEEMWVGDRGAKRRNASTADGNATSRRRVSHVADSGHEAGAASGSPRRIAGHPVGISGILGSNAEITIPHGVVQPVAAPPKGRGRGTTKKRDRRQSTDDGRRRQGHAAELLPDETVMPKVADEHPFWVEMATYFRDVSNSDVQQLQECVGSTTVDLDLMAVPPPGRPFQACWAERAHVAEAHTQAQAIGSMPPDLDFDEPGGPHEEMAGGEATRNLVALLVEENTETYGLGGTGVRRRSQAPLLRPVASIARCRTCFKISAY